MEAKYRKPTSREKQILENLVALDFEGAFNLRTQLDNILVRNFEDSDDYGSIEIITSAGMDGVVNQRVPAEGRVNDTDGVAIDTLLHVTNGRLSELEFIKLDGSQIVNEPQPKDFTYKVR